MDFYLDERERKKRRRLLKLKIYGGVFLFFALIIGSGYLVVYSSLFKVKNINITQINTDEKRINTDNIIQDLKDFFVNQSKIASFLGSDNILIWNSKKLAEFPKNPEIAELTIEKDYIERQVKITVQEREKFGVWCPSPFVDNTSGCYWFDKNGIIFEEAPMVEGDLINNVDDFSGRSFKLGESVLGEKFFSNLLKIFDVLEESDLGIKSLKLERIELQEISTNPSTSSGQAESSPKIYFSLRIDPGFTLAAIDSMKKIGLEKIEYIDLRVENRVYYKLK